MEGEVISTAKAGPPVIEIFAGSAVMWEGYRGEHPHSKGGGGARVMLAWKLGVTGDSCLVLLPLTGAVVSLKWLTEDIGEEVQEVAFMVNVQLSQRLTNDSRPSA